MAAVFRNGNLFCTNCGQSQELKMPMTTSDFVKQSQKFESDHENCAEVWQQTYPPDGASFEDRKRFWLENGEHGTSSMCIFMHLTGQLNVNEQRNNYPYDPDDFRRCHELLLMIPQLREDMPKMAILGPEWKNLSENWDELTRLYLDQIATQKPNGMYELMKKLINYK